MQYIKLKKTTYIRIFLIYLREDNLALDSQSKKIRTKKTPKAYTSIEYTHKCISLLAHQLSVTSKHMCIKLK